MHSDRTLTTRSLRPGTAVVAILIALAGCDSGQDQESVDQARSGLAATEGAEAEGVDETAGQPALNTKPQRLKSATAQIDPTSAGNAHGTVIFFTGAEGQDIRVSVDLEGLEPGLHGFHIHEKGDCSAPDASSAGGHFNPYNVPHGSPNAEEHHVGDMGNLEADSDGRVVVEELSFPSLAFSGSASILQKAVVIHSKADDFTSQPSGNAGARVGCGVIGELAGKDR